MSATTTGAASRNVDGMGLVEFEEEPYHRYWFTPDGGQRRRRMRSVTTILRESWAAPQLIDWAARQGDRMPAAREAAFTRGRAVHKFIETYMSEGRLLSLAEHGPEIQGYLTAAAAFLFDLDPQPIAVERLVCWPERGYAGRLDLIATVDGVPTLLDFKTNPDGKVYPEAHAQVHAYQLAEERCEGAEIQRRLIVGLAEDGSYNPVEGVDSADVWQTCLAFDQWRIKHMKAVGNGR